MEESLSSDIHNNITISEVSSQGLPPHIHQDLTQVFNTLQSSLHLLYLHYKPHVLQYEGYFKLFALAFLVYVFYKLGGMTVTDKIQSEKQELRKFIEIKKSIQEVIPKRIKEINSNTIKIIVLVILLAAAYAYAFQTGHQEKLQEFQNPIVIAALVILCYLVYTNILKMILSSRLKQVNKLNEQYFHKLNHFTQSLGPKALAILRHHLCRDAVIKFSSSKSINECNKAECKQARGLLKQKNDGISSLVEETVDFQWCSICKKKQPFDEHLHFEAMPYEKKSEDQNEEIKDKMGYLIDGLDRMRKWLSETSPCNCSKLYWTTSTKLILEYKKTQKAIDSKMKSSSMKKIEQKA